MLQFEPGSVTGQILQVLLNCFQQAADHWQSSMKLPLNCRSNCGVRTIQRIYTVGHYYLLHYHILCVLVHMTGSSMAVFPPSEWKSTSFAGSILCTFVCISPGNTIPREVCDLAAKDAGVTSWIICRSRKQVARGDWHVVFPKAKYRSN